MNEKLAIAFCFAIRVSKWIEKYKVRLCAHLSQSDNFNIKEKWLASPSFGYHLDGNDWSKPGCFFALGHSDWMQSWLCLFIRQRVRPRSAARLFTIATPPPSSLRLMLPSVCCWWHLGKKVMRKSMQISKYGGHTKTRLLSSDDTIWRRCSNPT